MKLFLGYLFIALSLSLAGQVYGLDIYWQQESARQNNSKDKILTAIASRYTKTVTPVNTRTATASPTPNLRITPSPTFSATPTKVVKS